MAYAKHFSNLDDLTKVVIKRSFQNDTPERFAEQMQGLGFESNDISNLRWYLGLAIQSEQQNDRKTEERQNKQENSNISISNDKVKAPPQSNEKANASPKLNENTSMIASSNPFTLSNTTLTQPPKTQQTLLNLFNRKNKAIQNNNKIYNNRSHRNKNKRNNKSKKRTGMKGKVHDALYQICKNTTSKVAVKTIQDMNNDYTGRELVLTRQNELILEHNCRIKQENTILNFEKHKKRIQNEIKKRKANQEIVITEINAQRGTTHASNEVDKHCFRLSHVAWLCDSIINIVAEKRAKLIKYGIDKETLQIIDDINIESDKEKIKMMEATMSARIHIAPNVNTYPNLMYKRAE